MLSARSQRCSLHLPSLLCLADASTYAHYLFHAFDTTQTGSVKFEVRVSLGLPGSLAPLPLHHGVLGKGLAHQMPSVKTKNLHPFNKHFLDRERSRTRPPSGAQGLEGPMVTAWQPPCTRSEHTPALCYVLHVISSLNPGDNPRGGSYYVLPVAEEGSKAKRGHVPFPRSHSKGGI